MNKKEKIIQQIIQDIEKHYADKFTYAIPTWAKLSAQPEIISILPIHGKEGIVISKQRVDFDVNFSEISSIVRYSKFLSDQMNKELDILAYVVFFNKRIRAIKDPNYLPELTVLEENDRLKYNENQLEIDVSCLFFTAEFDLTNSLDDVI